MNNSVQNEMFQVLKQHGIAARPTRSGDYEAVFLEQDGDIVTVQRILHEASIVAYLNFTYGVPMFVNLGRKTS